MINPAIVLCSLLFVLLSSFSSFAANYYLSSSSLNASDTGPGSQTQPWKTIAKVNATTLAAGDAVHFLCGDVWREALAPRSSGTSSARITFRSYGTGNKPVISGANIVTGWSSHTGGTANTYSAPLAVATWMVTSDSSYLKRGTSKTALAMNQYFWETGVLFINIGGSPTGHMIEAAQRSNAVYANAKNYITLSGFRLEKTNLPSVSLYNSTFWKVENCDLYFANNSSTYAGGGIHADTAHDIIVTGNHINYVLGDGVLIWRSLRAEVSNNLIENVLDEGRYGGSDAIQIGAKSTTPNACANFKILNNITSRPSTTVQKGCIIAELGDNGVISGNTCRSGRFGLACTSNNTIIENNYVTGFGTGGGIVVSENRAASGMKIRYNVVSNSLGFTGISLINPTSTTPVNRSNFEIHNNVVYNTYYGIAISQPFSGSIRNNIVWSDGNSNPRSRLSISSVISGQSLTINNNIWQDKGTETMISFPGGPYTTLAAWQQATGHDLNSTTADPRWVSPSTGDFHLRSDSPALNAGANVGLAFDFEGNPVPQGGTPDMGALEYGPLTISAEADTYVWDGSPTSNYGSASSLRVKEYAGWTRISYLRFPVSGLITAATLKLKVVAIAAEGAGNRTIEVRQLANDTWSETGTTWNLKPASTGTLIATITNAGTVGQTYSIDVTSYVNAQSSDGKASFCLVQPANVGKLVEFGSRENSSNAPVLEVQTGVREVDAEADTYVWDGSPTSNYASDSSLRVKASTAGYNRISYLRFPVSGAITAATLKLKVVAIAAEGTGNRTIEVRQVTDDTWSETGTTWNLKPASTGTLIATITNAGTVGQTYNVDVTSFVSAQSSDGKASFCLIQPTNVGRLVEFGSRENSSNKPMLEIQ